MKIYRAATRIRRCSLVALILIAGSFLVPPQRVRGQDGSGEQPASLTYVQLAELVGPIALYPDKLIAIILPASTYPLEVVQAARWVKKNPHVSGKALEDAMEKQEWDPAVKSLTAFPQVLDMMNADLAWTQKLGDAFLAQSEDVLASVQLLRAKADKAGHLETTKEANFEITT